MSLALTQHAHHQVQCLVRDKHKRSKHTILSPAPFSPPHLDLGDSSGDPPRSSLPLLRRRFPPRIHISYERLSEPIPNSSYMLCEAVMAIQQNQPFPDALSIPLSQVKVLMYFGLSGSTVTTEEVEDTLFNLNLYYDHRQTASLLLALAQEKRISMEEHYTETNRLSRTWQFPTLNVGYMSVLQTHKQRRGRELFFFLRIQQRFRMLEIKRVPNQIMEKNKKCQTIRELKLN